MHFRRRPVASAIFGSLGPPRLPLLRSSSRLLSLFRKPRPDIRGRTPPGPERCAGLLWTVAACLLAVNVPDAAELKPETIKAFEHYRQVTEARIQRELNGDVPFLWVDRLPEREREERYAELRAGAVVVEKLETREEGDKIDVPKGRIHHWIATIVIPGVGLEQTLAMVGDYDRYAEIYSPVAGTCCGVIESRLLERDGDRYKAFLRLYAKKVWTLVHNTEYDVRFLRLDENRAHVPSHATRIQEVEHPGTPEEREKPEGQDRGTMWRFANYCSFEERGGDTYMQCESITLTRGVPFLVNVIIRPIINGLPKDLLQLTLGAARRHLTGEPSAEDASR